jgi:hypothetical protein
VPSITAGGFDEIIAGAPDFAARVQGEFPAGRSRRNKLSTSPRRTAASHPASVLPERCLGDFGTREGDAQNAGHESGGAVGAFLTTVSVVQAADSVGANLVGALAAVRLLHGDRQFLTAVVKAAEQTGDARSQLGIDGEGLVGLRLGAAGAAVRQGSQRGVDSWP